ncbi:hypothetical protein [Saccharothrix algeriensis]|uniref:Iron-regulated membrane protein n=1 Tax=Saccharothrix algeriensis TaxID=173560 RepID=A0ABS2S302_9PSEU|nr:hypothetical protein [Saccharothrix algeriensis]MBM7810631.1 putative iron-regulated membrane protein [Saccharothrix algeriensis]
MNDRGWGAGEAAVCWLPRRRQGRHARARPPAASPAWVSALLGMVLLVSLLLLLLTYV